jgi:hypothetical protein
MQRRDREGTLILEMEMFYIEQTRGEWAGFMTGQGVALSNNRFLVCRFAPEPELRVTQVAYCDYRQLIDFTLDGEDIVWFSPRINPVLDMIERQQTKQAGR